MYEESSSHSLWDTLTCAILVTIVLLAVSLVQLIAEKRALETDGIPVDIAERLEGAASTLITTEQALRERTDELAGLGDTEAERQALDQRLEELGDEPSRIKELMTRVVETRDAESRTAAALQQSLAAVADLRGEIDRRGIAPPPASTTLALPIRRAIQQDLKAVTFVSRFGRVYPLDYSVLAGTFRDAVADLQRQIKANVPLVQRLNMARTHFAQADVGNELFRLRLLNVLNGREFVGFFLVTEPRRDVGESLDEALKEGSRFLTLVRGVDPTTQYISFLVWSDSFDSYIALRRRVEDLYARGDSRATQVGLSWMPFAEDQSLQEFWDVLGRNSGRSSGRSAKGTVIDNP